MYKDNIDAPILTEELLAQALPKQVRNNVTSGLLEIINNISNSDNHMRACYRDNLLGYSNVLKEGKYKLTDYVSAVRFVSYRLMGFGIHESYIRTFPDRAQRLLDEGATAKYMSSFSSAYNKTKLVTVVTEQTLIPTHILNADLFQEAINTQAELMRSANSEKVRSDACNSLMVQLRPPENKKIELDIGIRESTTISELRETTRLLAEEQSRIISAGLVSALDIANSKVIEGELV